MWQVRVWLARVFVLAVFVGNVSCALAFIITPATLIAGYELSGLPGSVAIRGIGIAFLMWNATYPLVIINPVKFRVLYIIVLVQQIIGLLGEGSILATLPAGHSVLADGIARFVAFDLAGLTLLLAGFLLVYKKSEHPL
ncbi:MAG: hypothetical protein FWF71_07540 [Actinomycetia bacterium]|nr:hypothetical protein [Actinomycetes bacterium]